MDHNQAASDTLMLPYFNFQVNFPLGAAVTSRQARSNVPVYTLILSWPRLGRGPGRNVGGLHHEMAYLYRASFQLQALLCKTNYDI